MPSIVSININTECLGDFAAQHHQHQNENNKSTDDSIYDTRKVTYMLVNISQHLQSMSFIVHWSIKSNETKINAIFLHVVSLFSSFCLLYFEHN